jgi:hypothetical protein
MMATFFPMSGCEKVAEPALRRQIAEGLVDFILWAGPVPLDRLLQRQNDHWFEAELVGHHIDNVGFAFRCHYRDPVVPAPCPACIERSSTWRTSSANLCCAAAEPSQERDDDQRCVETRASTDGLATKIVLQTGLDRSPRQVRKLSEFFVRRHAAFRSAFSQVFIGEGLGALPLVRIDVACLLACFGSRFR